MPETLKIFTTAILVFANSSEEELKHKAIPKGSVLFQGLTEHAISTAKKTGLPYFLLTEKEQYGNSFGERFVNAIKSIFDKGFDNVITIGNDTPQLKVSDIVKASGNLSANKFVLGPSSDGGFYLMGLHKSQFDTKAFVELPWKTNTLAKKITTVIESSNVRVIQLRVLLDLDTNADLKRILKGLNNGRGKIFQIILSLVTSTQKIILQAYIPLSFRLNSTYFNKGSPFHFIN
ncbi:DUF2064 domain-containing protein [Arenibacter sp. S6351L]|uniref:TIGR04282 family arsenosugar biosynthesis glycosyltransferase n=1 Tax=Arenibacter sp. S6351L TaxID=2926407 RepID=UPI001FF6C669|nr:DUF2064 domain-containing protein [Arenibacter sp. S6351L]MCK0132709.1 DUF2064 domain-containing protein [Arenibacter sp. S6351L]